MCRLRSGLCPQIQPGEILPRLRRAHEENPRRREKAETKAEMSRFRAFQTRINQGFSDYVEFHIKQKAYAELSKEVLADGRKKERLHSADAR